MPKTVSPSLEDPVVRGASTIIGGPVGKHARPPRLRWFRAPLALLMLATSVTFGLGYLQKKPCRDHAWSHEYQYTRMCYTDPWALFYSAGLDSGQVPYRDRIVEYPALIGGTMYFAALVADDDGDGVGGNPKRFFDVTAVLMLGCALAVTVGLVRGTRLRPWDAAMFAFAPTLLMHGLTNWDLLAVAFATLGVAAWSRRWPVAAGVCIGLGTAAKLYPLLFLIPLLALAFRSRQLREAGRVALIAVGTFVAINVPAFFFSSRIPYAVRKPDPTDTCRGFFDPERTWWEFFNRNRCRGADWDSIWYAAQSGLAKMRLFGRSSTSTLDPTKVNVASLVLFLILMSAIVALALTAPRRPRLGQLLFLTVASFLLVNKVYSPQYVLWLVPLAVLARPRWRMFLAWQATEIFLTFTRFYFFVHNAGQLREKPDNIGLQAHWFLSAVLLRDVVLIVLMALVVREIRYPHLDVVRRYGHDDPSGGVFDDAPDRYDEPLPPPRPALASI